MDVETTEIILTENIKGRANDLGDLVGKIAEQMAPVVNIEMSDLSGHKNPIY